MKASVFESNGLWMYQMTEEDIAFFSPYERAGDSEGYVVYQTPEAHIRQMADGDLFYGMLMDATTDEPVGYVLLAGLLSPHRSLELRRLVIFETGLGHGRRAVVFLKAYASKCLKCHRLWLDVRAHNERAYHLYKSEGFQDEGTLRDAVFWNDQFVDVKLLSVLEKDFYSSGDDTHTD